MSHQLDWDTTNEGESSAVMDDLSLLKQALSGRDPNGVISKKIYDCLQDLELLHNF